MSEPAASWPAGITERLRAGTLLGAEGHAFELGRRGYVKAGPCVPEVVLDLPEAVTRPHREPHPVCREAVTAKGASFAAAWNA